MKKICNAETRRDGASLLFFPLRLCAFAVFFSISFAQQNYLSGNLHNDLLASLQNDSLLLQHHSTIDEAQLKHPLRSGLYSIILPG